MKTEDDDKNQETTDDNREVEHSEEELEQLANESFEKGADRVLRDEPPDEATVKPAAAQIDDKGDEADKGGETDDGKPEPKPEPKEKEFNAEESAKTIETLTTRLNSLEGKQGSVKAQIEAGVKREMKKLAEKSTGGPTETEISAALTDPEAMDKLMDQYPVFAPIAVELRANREALAKQNESIDKKIEESEQRTQQRTQTEEIQRQERVERDELNAAYGDWQDTVASDDFKKFALEGGPSLERYTKISDLMAEAHAKHMISPEANAVVEGWQDDFPDWWTKFGANLFGGIKGSIKILDQYAVKSDKPEKTEAEKAEAKKAAEEAAARRRQKRTDSTVTVDGKESAPTTGALTDEEAFIAGADKVLKQRKTG